MTDFQNTEAGSSLWPRTPCCKGCGEGSGVAADSYALPDPGLLNAELDLLVDSGPDTEAELELAGIDAELAPADDPAAFNPAAAPPVSLDDLVACAQHYPGLKITLSF